MDFPTFPPHFPSTDYLFYPSLLSSSAFSIPSPASIFFDSDRPLSSTGTRPGTASSERSRPAPVNDREIAESIAASRRRQRINKRRAADLEVEDRNERYEYLILFIPGNPGLIGYYRPFLSKLSELLQQSSPTDGIVNMELGGKEKPPVSILGISHAGFSIYDKDEGMYEEDEMEDEQDDLESNEKKSHWTEWGSPPYSLRQQIDMKVEFTEWIYEWYRQRQDYLGTIRSKDGTRWGTKRLKIIYMGHSVGGYMLLETVKLLNQKRKGKTKEPSAECRKGRPQNGAMEADIVGGILLFPTIQDIALSKKGKMFAPVVTRIPKVHILGKVLMYMFLYIIPSAWLRWIVGKVTGFLKISQPLSHKKLDKQQKKMVAHHGHTGDDRNNEEMLAVTMCFLQSKHGVEEALYMCRDEMLEIKEDKWGEEIWGVPYLAPTAVVSSPTRARSQQLMHRVMKGSDYKRRSIPSISDGLWPDEQERQRHSQTDDDDVNFSPLRRSWKSSADDNLINKKRLKLVMYFAKDDHWVASKTRDSLIKLRGRRFQPQHPSMSALRQRRLSSSAFSRSNRSSVNTNLNELQVDTYIDSGYADDNDTTTCVTDCGEDGVLASREDAHLALEKYKPQMIICKDGLPHGFCIAHGEIMAAKVFGWVEEMIVAEEEECIKREGRKEGR